MTARNLLQRRQCGIGGQGSAQCGHIAYLVAEKTTKKNNHACKPSFKKVYHQYTTCNSRKRRQCGIGGQGSGQCGHVADLVDAKAIKQPHL